MHDTFFCANECDCPGCDDFPGLRRVRRRYDFDRDADVHAHRDPDDHDHGCSDDELRGPDDHDHGGADDELRGYSCFFDLEVGWDRGEVGGWMVTVI